MNVYIQVCECECVEWGQCDSPDGYDGQDCVRSSQEPGAQALAYPGELAEDWIRTGQLVLKPLLWEMLVSQVVA